MYATAALVEHAAVGFALAVLSLFVLAFAVIAVVLVTISNTCWWRLESDVDPLMDDATFEELCAKDLDPTAPIETVLGLTPENASIV